MKLFTICNLILNIATMSQINRIKNPSIAITVFWDVTL
jgi:hypothetical protein